MKKSLFLTLVISIFCLTGAVAQDTIAAWTFPAISADEDVDISNAENGSRYLSAEDSSRNDFDVVEYTFDGVETPGIVDDKCAGVNNWLNGAGQSKSWIIKIKTPDVENITIQATQKSDVNGPKNFYVQWHFSDGPWETLDSVVLTDSWGAITNVALPAICNDTTKSIYIRWIMKNDDGINGGTLDSNAYSYIDNIIISGTDHAAVRDFENDTRVSLYPNPSNGQINLECTENINNVKVFDINGKMVYLNNNVNNFSSLDLNIESGIYFMQINLDDNNTITRKVIIN